DAVAFDLAEGVGRGDRGRNVAHTLPPLALPSSGSCGRRAAPSQPKPGSRVTPRILPRAYVCLHGAGSRWARIRYTSGFSARPTWLPRTSMPLTSLRRHAFQFTTPSERE